MKMIRCIINPVRLEHVKKTLWSHGIKGVTVIEAQGLGAGTSSIAAQKDDYVGDFSPRLCVDVAVEDSEVERILEMVVESVRTGRVGDGKIFVSSLDQVVRVRTGERGKTAL